MQMIKVSMCDQDEVESGKIPELHARFPNPLQDKEPARKIGIDDDVLATDLDKKAGVSDEGESELAVCDQSWLVCFSSARRDSRMTHQPSERPGSLAKCWVLEAGL